MKFKVLRIEGHFGDIKELEDLLNDGWSIERSDVLQGNTFSKYTSHTYVIYILKRLTDEA
jgi:hypothetical protein